MVFPEPSTAQHEEDERSGGRGKTVVDTVSGTPRWSSRKYLGVHLDNRLEWTGNRGQSRLDFLRRLRSFEVCRPMLNMFYVSNGISHHTYYTWVPLHNILAEHRSTFS